MVDISDYVDRGDDQPDEAGEAADLVALKDCLKGLADAIASTNLAVINATQGDSQAATARVQASIAALKRFHIAFSVLDAPPPEIEAEAEAAPEGEEDE